MYSKVKLFGHPIHAMLVGFPVTLYTATLLSYIAYQASGDIFWFRVGIAANVAGVVMALLTAIPGFLDWLLGIPGDAAAKGTGLRHMLLNVTALVVFAINAGLHLGYWNSLARPDATLAIILGVIGVGVTLTAGWLGWNLVQKHHVGVEMPTEVERPELRRAA
jgi:uncharacterized membrane protein